MDIGFPLGFRVCLKLNPPNLNLKPEILYAHKYDNLISDPRNLFHLKKIELNERPARLSFAVGPKCKGPCTIRKFPSRD